MCLETHGSDLLRPLTKEQMDHVVDAVKHALSDPALRALSQRAIQAKIWHTQTVVSAVLQDLRNAEELVRSAIFKLTSKLVYSFNEHSVDATLQRAGILPASDASPTDMGTKCLDTKERLYLILKEYGWLQDFFRRYPIHFYENSFQFVDRIPTKDLPAKVKVIGLGIGGSMAVSGLAKHGIYVEGYEKRPEFGPSSVTSRYQNASWRAYDTAAGMVNEEAFDLLIQNRQRIHVQQPDGSVSIHESDRVQIILGAAIGAALKSAREYGANLTLECSTDDYCVKESSGERDTDNKFDIVALFCGAHTASSFPGILDGDDKLWEWPELDSSCKMWLRVQVSDKVDAYCTRGGEIGAEKWHYTIESARNDLQDLERVAWNQESQYKYNLRKLQSGVDIGMNEEQLLSQYDTEHSRLQSVIDRVKNQQLNDCTAVGCRFDYIFTNAPANDHNRAKRDSVEDAIVLEGAYTVEIKMATNCTINSGETMRKLGADLVVLGGDACVPPNPLAAYGATLACEAAASLVLLAIGTGHLNAILESIATMADDEHSVEWKDQIDGLKSLLGIYYEAKARSETYFQFVQTLICNLYSLPAFY